MRGPEPQNNWPVRRGEAGQIDIVPGGHVHQLHRGQIGFGNRCRLRCRRRRGGRGGLRRLRGRGCLCGLRRRCGGGNWCGLRRWCGGGWGRRSGWCGGGWGRRSGWCDRSGRCGGFGGLRNGRIGGLRRSRRSFHAVVIGSRLCGRRGRRLLRWSRLGSSFARSPRIGRRGGGGPAYWRAVDRRRLGVPTGNGDESENEGHARDRGAPPVATAAVANSEGRRIHGPDAIAASPLWRTGRAALGVTRSAGRGQSAGRRWECQGRRDMGS